MTGKIIGYFRVEILAFILIVAGNGAIGQHPNKGSDAYGRGDYQAALEHYLPLAGQGNADAQYHLGLMYLYGNGVLADLIGAHMWFNIASANGYYNAPLLRAYAEETMTPEDISEAVNYARTCMSSNYQNCR